MGETTVISVRSGEPYDLYIGRTMNGAGVRARYGALTNVGWGNPYRGPDALTRYERFVRGRPDLMARLPELRGKRLACWCKWPNPNASCHGDVLVKLLRELDEGGAGAPHRKPKPPGPPSAAMAVIR